MVGMSVHDLDLVLHMSVNGRAARRTSGNGRVGRRMPGNVRVLGVQDRRVVLAAAAVEPNAVEVAAAVAVVVTSDDATLKLIARAVA